MGTWAERQRRKYVRELAKAYPYIWAWGKYMGSFEYYMVAECEVAKADGAPANVFHRQDLTRGHATDTERERWLASEAAGTALVLRDDTGSPMRGWGFVTDIKNPDTRERIEEYARAYLDGPRAVQ